MRRLLLVFCVAAIAAGHAIAQPCTPPAGMPDGVWILPEPYMPDDPVPGTGIVDEACVGAPFTMIFDIQVPAQFEVPGLGTIPLESLSLATTGAVSGLPASFNYACNPPNCVFPANSIGCIAVSGTPQAGNEGEHDLSFAASLSTSGLSMPIHIPEDTSPGGVYVLRIHPSNHPSCLVATQETPWSHVKSLYRDLD
jgi:hypothetical protein